MAKIAREAGISVGAVYARYPEKNVYLYHLIGDAFRSMRDDVKLVLNGSSWRRESASFIAGQIVAHLVAKMTTPRAAGVIRAAIKLATVKPIAIELFEEYRTEVTDLSVALLSPKLRKAPPSAIRIGMQIVLATITDAVLQKRAGPMSAGSARMAEALTNLLLGYLGLSGDSWAGNEAEGEDEPDESVVFEAEDEVAQEDKSNRVYDPDLRAYKGRIQKPAEPKRARGPKNTEPAPKLETVTPPRTPKPPAEPPPKPARKVKRRFI